MLPSAYWRFQVLVTSRSHPFAPRAGAAHQQGRWRRGESQSRAPGRVTLGTLPPPPPPFRTAPTPPLGGARPGLLPVHGPNDNKGPSLSTWLQTRRGNSFSQLPMTFQLLVLSSGSQLDSPWVPLPVLQSGQLVKAAHWAEVHRHRHAVRHSVAITPNRSLGPCVASAFPKHH